MPNRIALAIYLFLFMLSATSNYAQMAEESAVDQLFAQWSNTYSPGCAVAVIKDGNIIYKKGYGMADLEHDIPIRPESVFYIGSVSKQFVAACMLLLDEQGKIDLDADVRTYIPEFPDYGYPITIRNLIHHTSGVRDNLTLWELAGRSHLDEIPEEEIFDMICRQKELNFEPGTKYLYSNSCYFLMSIIVKRASGKSLREYADEYIFQPLGMQHSIFQDNNRRMIKNRAFAYGQNPDGSFNSMLMRFDLVGSGGLYSTVEDLFRWDQNFYNNKIGNRGPAFIQDMLTNGRYKDGTEVGYAFALENGHYKGLPTVSHGGALGGYRSFYLRFPEQHFSVVILSNLENFLPEKLAEQVADIYLKDNFVAAPSTAIVKKELPTFITLKPKQLDAVSGLYWNEEGAYSRKVYVRNDTLRYSRGEGNESALLPIDAQHFIMDDTNGEVAIHFQKAEKNQPAQMLFTVGNQEAIISTQYEPYTLDEKALKAIPGHYYSSELDTRYQLGVKEKQLFVKIKNQDWLPLKPIKSDLFTQERIGQFYLDFDKNGNATGFRLQAGRVRNLLFTRL
ncbi:MAG: serine hydrolase domain-containing protein [Saprospiraceae bacterium]